jgi:hypothetical protein
MSRRNYYIVESGDYKYEHKSVGWLVNEEWRS